MKRSILSSTEQAKWRFCVAPMIAVTDRHCRYLLRLISRHTRLYTEMVACPAIIHGDRDYLLGFSKAEHPLALQLGGHNPEEFAQCARIAEEYGYNEININVGCPSDRVQSGRFGACLMKEPIQVAECFSALQENCNLDITIKCRIGVDNFDSYDFLENFIETLISARCSTFIIHARIALLKGLSPKENRNIPPLNYERVSLLKSTFPTKNIILNGGINSIYDSQQWLEQFDGVMLGRAIYKDPFMLSQVDDRFFNEKPMELTRHKIVSQFLPYIHDHIKKGNKAHNVTRHLVGLFHGQKFSRQWRTYISSNPIKETSDLQNLLKLAAEIEARNSDSQELIQYA